MAEIVAGEQVTLYQAKLYPTPRSPKFVETKTGTFYLWSDDIVNEKVRITTNTNNIGKPGCITGWVNVSDLNKEIPTSETIKGGFVAGQSVELDNTNFYPNSAIDKVSATRSGTYYIWGADIVNGRIRITNDPSKAGKSGYILAWVKVSEIV